MRKSKSGFPKLTWAVFFACVASFAAAQPAPNYPNKNVRIVIPFTPGGATDSIGRLIADRLSKVLGQSFIVENRGGADTVVGTVAVAKAAPDGYTLLINTPGLLINHWSNASLPYDTAKDLVPVALLTRGEWLLVTHPSVPADNLRDLITYAKANPGKIKVAANGTATLLSQQLMNVSGTQMILVNYKGAAQASADLLSGRIDATLTALPNVEQHVTSGALKGIAVSGDKRDPKVPNVPTFAEGGLKEFEPTSWFAMFAPTNTPKEIIDTLNGAVRKVLAEPDVIKALADLGLGPYPATVGETEKFMKAELEKYGTLVKQVGLKAQ